MEFCPRIVLRNREPRQWDAQIADPRMVLLWRNIENSQLAGVCVK
jgi:hypothetical protein